MGSYVSGNELTVFASSKENQPQPARVLKDSKTGVQVHLQEGETAAIDSLSVRHIETGSSETPAVLGNQDYDLFDITLRDRQGQVVANTKDTLVYLPVDEGKTVLRVIYLPNTTQEEVLAFTETHFKDASGNDIPAIVFKASHFSEYGIVYKVTIPVEDNVASPDSPTTTLPVAREGGDLRKRANPMRRKSSPIVTSNSVKTPSILVANDVSVASEVNSKSPFGQENEQGDLERDSSATLPQTNDSSEMISILTGVVLPFLGLILKSKKSDE